MTSIIRHHYWHAHPSIQTVVKAIASDKERVVEIGPGFYPFELATEFIDWQNWKNITDKKFYQVDINKDPLPYEDKSIDFIYCRHTLEDIYNPFWVCKEMSRVAKSGYIETPSPIAEFCRGVDGGSPHWRGYIHHRYLIWIDQGRLIFLPKYPIIEYIDFDDEAEITELLNTTFLHWNTYFFWHDTIDFKILEHDLDFQIQLNYKNLIRDALEQSVENNLSFALQHSIML